MANVVEYIFARSYGYMLGRKRRNLPEEACQDAIGPLMIVVGVPLSMAALVVVGSLYPLALSSKQWVPWVTLSSGFGLYVFARRLRRYSSTPEIGTPFSSPGRRRASAVFFFLVVLGSVLVAGLLLRVARQATSSG